MTAHLIGIVYLLLAILCLVLAFQASQQAAWYDRHIKKNVEYFRPWLARCKTHADLDAYEAEWRVFAAETPTYHFPLSLFKRWL